MKVTLSERVLTALNMIGSSDRERVKTWFQYLERLDQDPFVKDHSVELSVGGKRVYLFRTSTDIRIFYTVDQQTQTVTVLDVTKADTIISSGNLSEGT
jgi:mRNA-degrading endonuclease RelE of RelBE toxin-antitoxin system